MYGFGASLAYTPSLVILGHYFKRYLGLVNGIVTAGSSVFTVIMPYLIEPLLKHFGLVGTLRSLAVLTSVVMACAVLFKPVPRKFIPSFYDFHFPAKKVKIFIKFKLEIQEMQNSLFSHFLKRKLIDRKIWKNSVHFLEVCWVCEKIAIPMLVVDSVENQFFKKTSKLDYFIRK